MTRSQSSNNRSQNGNSSGTPRVEHIRKFGVIGREVSYQSAGRRAAHFAHAHGAVLVEVDRAGHARLILAVSREARTAKPAAIVGVFDAGDSDCPKSLARVIEDAIRTHVFDGFRVAA